VIRQTKRHVARTARRTTLYIVVAGLGMIIIFPVFFLVSFSLMSDYEAYSEWPNPLIPKFSANFTLEQSAEKEVSFRLTRLTLADLRNAGLPEKVLEDMAIFTLTRLSIGELRNEGFPKELSEGLQPLRDQVFTKKNEFLNTVEQLIGREQTAKYKELILKHAEDLEVRLAKKFTEKDQFLATVGEYIGREQTVRYQDLIVKYAEEKYLLSIYNYAEGAYQRFGRENFSLKTEDLEKLTEFIGRKANCTVSVTRLKEEITKLENQERVNFSLRKSLLANYILFFQVTRNSVPSVFRSLYTAFSTIAISLVIGGMAGFAFARYRFKGRNILKLSVLFVRMFPGVAIAIPMVIILGNIGLYDKPVGLSLVYSVTQIALTIWITASIFLGIPVELEEAALIFGTTRLGAFWHITLPLALPGLAACAMYAFIASWNEAAQAIILTQFNPTFPVVVYEVLTTASASGQLNLLTAGSIAQALPAVIFTLFIRKYIVHMWGGVRV
jgi:multiple sugar transport system permease protein